ncbi:MAG: methyltransferase [Myxococcota bacterium]
MARAVSVTESPGENFGHAIVWPRSHLGKDFTIWCLATGALALREGGTLWCAVRKAKGAQSLTDEIGQMMGEVDVIGRSKGYRLLRARRGLRFDQARARAHVDAHYVIDDEALLEISLWSAPGVFSRKELDAGTRMLIEHANRLTWAPSVVVDLGCGVGPLSLWAARRWSHGRVLGVDSNLRAVALARKNAQRYGLNERVTIMVGDGMPPRSNPAVAHLAGHVELALVNPPTHADPHTLGRLIRELREWMAPTKRSVVLMVVSRAGRMMELLTRAGAEIQTYVHPHYTILEARWKEPERSMPLDSLSSSTDSPV